MKDDIIRAGDTFVAKFDTGETYTKICKKKQNWNGYTNCLSKTQTYTKIKES